MSVAAINGARNGGFWPTGAIGQLSQLCDAFNLRLASQCFTLLFRHLLGIVRKLFRYLLGDSAIYCGK